MASAEVPAERVGCTSFAEESQEEEGEEDFRVDAAPLDISVKGVAGLVANMEPVHPSMLRATRAGLVLKSGGSALRGFNRDLYQYSDPVQSIEVFWSHSWHGNRHLKILLLLLLYNGPPAIILATISAGLMMVLQSSDLLPGWERGTRFVVDQGAEQIFGTWCTLTGGLVFTVLLLTWRSKRRVFYDQMCIQQQNVILKTAGILSIGACLKHSDQLLIVWDDTYAARLWCMLELAAFLKSHELQEQKVQIRLAVMAPCILGVGFALWATMLQWLLFFDQTYLDTVVLLVIRWPFMYFAAAALRSHYRNTEAMLRQLTSFTVESAGCHCCKRGQACLSEICDRAVIKQCIRTWYGSAENFEETVKTRVQTMLYRQLGGMLFPYGWKVVGGSPLLWGFCDMTAARLRSGSWRAAAIMFAGGLAWWLFFCPHLFQLALLLARYFRKKAPGTWQDRFKSMAVALLLTLVSFIGNITSLVQGRLPTLLWFTAPVLVAGVTWLISRYQAVTQNSAELDPENRVGNQVHSLDGAVDTIVSL
ncbi:unnamed protein product [Symbiodinium natans]|uniref:Uncharacterized protein n=1 Tax=Symbiodinium natans TaxID=878477 RepID=A0A812H9R8_9DINO|nr:unnamed protein product [Symbiodinium natans]